VQTCAIRLAVVVQRISACGSRYAERFHFGVLNQQPRLLIVLNGERCTAAKRTDVERFKQSRNNNQIVKDGIKASSTMSTPLGASPEAGRCGGGSELEEEDEDTLEHILSPIGKPVKRQTKAKAKEERELKVARELELADLFGRGGVLGPEHEQVMKGLKLPELRAMVFTSGRTASSKASKAVLIACLMHDPRGGAALAGAASSAKEPQQAGGGGDGIGDAADPSVLLDEEQQLAVKLAVAGKNIFVSGGAGTGKSVVVEYLKMVLRGKGKVVAVTASTGIAAVNVGGTTLHSFSGIGLGRETKEDLVTIVRDKPHVTKRVERTDVLILDEVSMLEEEILDKVNFVFQQIRRNEEPFGGMQIIMVGDFCQLPPVGPQGKEPVFAFEGTTWTSLDLKTVILLKVWRQAESPAFVEILQEIRLGECSAKSISFLQALKQPLGERATGIEATGVSGVVPTFLHSHRFNVEKKNLEEFAKIKEVPVTFISEDGGTTSQVIMDNWLKALQVCGFSQGMWE